MSQAEDQAYIDAIIAYANRKRCEVEKRKLLDLLEKTDLNKDRELAEFYFAQLKEMCIIIQELYQQSRRGGHPD